MARKNDRSLGFIPLVLMAVIWAIVVKWQFAAIGHVTSRAGYFNPDDPRHHYGCPIPRAAQ